MADVILTQAQIDNLKALGNTEEDNHILACPRVPVDDCPVRIPAKWIEDLEQNQKIRSCCRHPENQEIAAFYSSQKDRDAGVPDVYVFYCTCGRKHRRFVVGGSWDAKLQRHTHRRPFWEIR